MFDFLTGFTQREETKYQEEAKLFYSHSRSNFGARGFHKNSVFIKELSEYEVLLNIVRQTPEMLVNVSLAYCIKKVAMESKINPRNRFVLSFSDGTKARYCWTAYMLLGSILPHKRFGHDSIKNETAGFNPQEELGVVWGFSSTSLFETQFQQYINESFIHTLLSGHLDDLMVQSSERDVFIPYAEYKNRLEQKKNLEEERANLERFTLVNNGVCAPEGNLGELPIHLIIRGIRHIPESAHELDLTNNNLGALGESNLVTLVKNIPFHIRLLRIRSNNLGNVANESLAALFKNLGPHISGLDLSSNALCKKSADDLIQIFTPISSGVTTLILRDNQFHFTTARYKALFAQLSKTIRSIYLQNREDTRRYHNDGILAEIFGDFPSRLVLKDTDFIQRANDELARQEREKEARQKQEAQQNVERNNSLLAEVKKLDVKARDVKNLLRSGADINVRDGDGYTPLMVAIDNQNDRIAGYLLNLGADPFITNRHKECARDLSSPHSLIYSVLKGYELLYSIFRDDLRAVRSLVRSGTDINFQGLGDYTALLIAVEQGSLEMVQFLLSLGADIGITRRDGQDVFDLVSNPEILQLLEMARHQIEPEEHTTSEPLFSAEIDEDSLSDITEIEVDIDSTEDSKREYKSG